MITYKFILGIGFANAKHQKETTVEDMGYSEKEWKELSEIEKEAALDDTWQDWIDNYIEGGWEKI